MTSLKRADPKRIGAYLGLVAGGLLVGFCVAELGVRLLRPTPRAPIVRGHGLHVVDGVPVWGDEHDRENRGCVEQHPERTRILFFGSSITFGVGLTAKDTFTAGLEEALNRARPTPGFCVLSFAQPGFQFEQKYAVARAEVPRYQPVLIMWESWVEWRKLRMIGDTAYSVSDFELDPAGFRGSPSG